MKIKLDTILLEEDTILLEDFKPNFEFCIKPDTTLIDKIKPKFLYIDKNIWENFSDTVKEDLKRDIYILPFKNFTVLTEKNLTCLIYTPSSDLEYEILKEKAIGGYYYEVQKSIILLNQLIKKEGKQ